jgi:hypothetical protein
MELNIHIPYPHIENHWSLEQICDHYLGALVIIEDEVIDFIQVMTYQNIICDALEIFYEHI